MNTSLRLPSVGGYTLQTIHLCKERVLRRFALEKALTEARIRNALIYKGPIPQWVAPVRVRPKTAFNLIQTKKKEKPKEDHKPAKTVSQSTVSRSAIPSDNEEEKKPRKRPETPRPEPPKEEAPANKFTKPPLQLEVPAPVIKEEKPRKPSEQPEIEESVENLKSQKNKANQKQKEKEKEKEPEKQKVPEEIEEDCEPLEEEPEVKEKKKKVKKVKKPKPLDKWQKDLLNELAGSCAEKLETWLLVKNSMSEKAKRSVSDKSIDSQNGETGKSKGKKKRGSASMSGPDDKHSKNRCNEEQRTFICTCSACCGPNSPCPCPGNPCEELDAIEEEQELECGETQVSNSCGACNSCPQCNPPDEDPCAEFFDVIRDSMEDAVKKSLEEVFSKYFCACMEKIQCLAAQIEHNECIMSKVFTDLNDKISYYGERNAQQFQYLCVRMEHDRLFYQQQQEYFLKQTAPQKPSCVDDTQEAICRCNKPDGLTDDEKERHKKGRYWECNLETDLDDQHTNDADDDDGGLRGSKSRMSKMSQGKPVPGKPEPNGKPMKKK